MNKVPTYIDGVASSQAIDTAGEIVDLKGLDISSLVGAAFNWEHLKDQPSQIVGKILEAKKIFTKEDCESERHLKYWDKLQIPFLYVMGRLFDDKKPSAVEVAALFKDDAEHPHEIPMVAFSVEGARLGEKKGMLVPNSIARKVTITAAAANKTCVAEMVPAQKEAKSDDFGSLFKGEMELFSFEPTYEEIMKKESGNALPGGKGDKTKPEDVDQEQLKMGIKHELEHTKDEKIAREIALDHLTEDPHYYTKLNAIEKSEWSSKLHSTGVDYSHKTHGTVGVKKVPIGDKHQFEIKHNDKLIGMSPDVKNASIGAKKYMNSLKKGETGHEKGVHSQKFGSSKGKVPASPHVGDYPQSSMGGAVRHKAGSSAYPKEMGAAIDASNKRHPKQEVDRVRSELSRMPNPKLPKSEDMGEDLKKALVDKGKTPHEKASARTARNSRTVTETSTFHPGKVGKFFGKKPEVKTRERSYSAGHVFIPPHLPGHGPQSGENSTHTRKVVGTPAKSMEGKAGRSSFQYAKATRKSEDLEKGENGDWQKEGYTLRHAKGRFNSGGDHLVQAFDNKGNHVAEAEFSEHHSKASGGRLHPIQAFVDHRHRRKGLASAMYRHVEEKTSLKVHPSHKQTIDGKKFSDNRKSENISEDLKKAMEAGSAMAAPSQLTQGAALGKESLERKMHKKEKSKGYQEADQAYSSWDKREKFRSYMKSRMPHLAEGEVDAIGRVLAFKQSKDKKKKISSMYAGTAIAAPASAAPAAASGGLAMSEKKK